MPILTSKKKTDNIFLRMHPMHRVLIGLGFSFMTFLLIRNTEINQPVKLIILWDVFALTYIVNSWIVYFTCSIVQIRKKAQEEDGSRLFVSVLILLSAFASMINVLLLIISKHETGTSKFIYVLVAIAGMVLSWVMVHTSFGFHYAHIYYDDDENDANIHAGGLDFPSDKRPNYLDFAYYSFVIGMTFQVSDVQITSRKLRRLTLLHGLLSFGLNTFVVALAINFIAGLRG